jgi:phosphoribosylformylglycinamidine cyclo-ligase
MRLNNGEFQEFEPSRGESAYLIQAAKSFFAHVEEGLGTKNLVADAMYLLTGRSYYGAIAQDTVAMIVNDMITVGALPLSVAMHLAVGDSSWFDDEKRCQDLVDGWERACGLARCVWGGGETPTPPDVVMPGAVVLSGSAMGIVKPKERLIQSSNIRHGDAIALIMSSGIHANGLTMARRIGEQRALPDGYLTRLDDGRTYGEALLDPTHIYVSLIEACLEAGVDIHYAVNITGHGWRKLMRATEPFVYVIERIPEPQPVFRFMQKHGPISDEEAYGNLNMGAGFALFVPETDMGKVARIADACGQEAMHGGYIERQGLQKKVVIKPKGIEFSSSSLAVR